MPSSSKGSVVLDASHAAAAAAWTLDELGRGGRMGSRMGEMDSLGNSPTHSAERRAAQDAAVLERRVEDAYASGYEAGRIAGELDERMRLRNAVATAEGALAELRKNEGRWQESVEANIAALAVAVARHLVGHELRAEPTVVAELVKRALAEFPIDQPLRIRVNPVDLSVLSMYATSSGDPIAIAPNRDVRWLADARIVPGGCVVEGRERIVDGRVDTALERVYRRLTDTNV